jgi:hypothetical protein
MKPMSSRSRCISRFNPSIRMIRISIFYPITSTRFDSRGCVGKGRNVELAVIENINWEVIRNRLVLCCVSEGGEIVGTKIEGVKVDECFRHCGIRSGSSGQCAYDGTKHAM